jgi:hypothetical protein
VNGQNDTQTGAALYLGAATSVLVESLLRRGRDTDLVDAQAAIDALAAVPTEPNFVVYQLPLLKTRALLARAQDDSRGYQTYADRYKAFAKALDFEGHMATAIATE